MRLYKRLLDYIDADQLEKEATSIKKGLRERVGKLLRRCRNQGIELDGISYEPCERYKFNEDLLFEWVAKNVDEKTLESLTKKTIDLDKLKELVLDGKIDTSKLDRDTYSITEYYKITVNHKKVSKWKK